MHITVRVPMKIRRRPGRKTVVTPVVDGLPTHTTTRADPALLKALARAFRYQRMLDDGRYASISEMAAAEKLDRGYLGRLLQLTLFAPDIVEAIVEGRQAAGSTFAGLAGAVPAVWDEQRTASGAGGSHGSSRRAAKPPSYGSDAFVKEAVHRPLVASADNVLADRRVDLCIEQPLDRVSEATTIDGGRHNARHSVGNLFDEPAHRRSDHG
jgi:hypothetical protein